MTFSGQIRLQFYFADNSHRYTDRGRSRGTHRGGRWGGVRDTRGGQQFSNGRGGGNIGGQLHKLKWDMQTLQPFRKDFYMPHVSAVHRSADEVKEYRKDREVTVKVGIIIYLIISRLQ